MNIVRLALNFIMYYFLILNLYFVPLRLRHLWHYFLIFDIQK
jgi:hypothetical protein